MADEPSREELPEIGRRLCGLLGVKPKEPVTAFVLRHVADEISDRVPAEKRGILYALRVCGNELHAHELPAEIRGLRDTMREYLTWWKRGREVRERARLALDAAIPVLDAEADARAQALKEVVPDAARAAGLEESMWPSPESLREYPRALRVLLEREWFVVLGLAKVLNDLVLTDADARVAVDFAPTCIRIAKALHEAGLTPAEITNALKPFAKPGKQRTKARNAVQGYLRAKSDDRLHVEASDGPEGEQLVAELREAARFVAGAGRDVRSYVESPFESSIESERRHKAGESPSASSRRRTPRRPSK